MSVLLWSGAGAFELATKERRAAVVTGGGDPPLPIRDTPDGRPDDVAIGLPGNAKSADTMLWVSDTPILEGNPPAKEIP